MVKNGPTRLAAKEHRIFQSHKGIVVCPCRRFQSTPNWCTPLDILGLVFVFRTTLSGSHETVKVAPPASDGRVT
jgi:hypothetical protein